MSCNPREGDDVTEKPESDAPRGGAKADVLPSKAAFAVRVLIDGEAERNTTLVVMEAGAVWPAWVKDVQRRAPNSMVEVQPGSESSDTFAGRVLGRLATLKKRGVVLRGALYAASSPASAPVLRARREICEALLEALSDDACGELVLSGAGWSSWGVDALSREELMGLAGHLSCRLEGRPVTVSVRFGEPPLESGVHRAAGVVPAQAGRFDAREEDEVSALEDLTDPPSTVVRESA